MEQTQIDRINELARIAKTRDLTEAEAEERQTLRAQYLADIRRNVKSQLEGLKPEA